VSDKAGILIALATFVVMLLIQTGGMFYWGGTISRAVKGHERRIEDLEEVHPREHG